LKQSNRLWKNVKQRKQSEKLRDNAGDWQRTNNAVSFACMCYKTKIATTLVKLSIYHQLIFLHTFNTVQIYDTEYTESLTHKIFKMAIKTNAC